jgi:hypothetical protein
MTIPPGLPLQVTHHVFVGTKCTKGVCTEINEHGMRVHIAHQLSVGDIVAVDVAFPEGGFRAYARVTYRNQYQYGLYFVDLEPEQQGQLAEFLQQLDIPIRKQAKGRPTIQ